MMSYKQDSAIFHDEWYRDFLILGLVMPANGMELKYYAYDYNGGMELAFKNTSLPCLRLLIDLELGKRLLNLKPIKIRSEYVGSVSKIKKGNPKKGAFQRLLQR